MGFHLGYTPFAVNYFDAYHVVEGGRVVDIWPIMPRGPLHGGLLQAPRGGRTRADPMSDQVGFAIPESIAYAEHVVDVPAFARRAGRTSTGRRADLAELQSTGTWVALSPGRRPPCASGTPAA